MNTDALKYRIFNALPAATYQMDRLISLLDIVESDRIETACVECKTWPRMLLNPDFVAEHCQTDEHLFLLVMHELYHVILGHTRLFEHPTPASNIVFDAIINSLLSHEFPEPEYTSFFQKLNPWESFPSRLLRPPPNWPNWDKKFPGDATKAQKKAIGLLYDGNHHTVTYHDVWEALLEDADLIQVGEPSGDGESGEDATLLGNHGGEGIEADNPEELENNETLRGILRGIIEQWPPPRTPISGRDQGRNPEDFLLDASETPTVKFLRALRKLLGKAGFYAKGTRHSHLRTIDSVSTEILTPIPQVRDRRAAGHRILHGRSPLLYQGFTQQNLAVRTPRQVAHVYLDISGSMGDAPNLLCTALKPFHRRGEVRIHVFSTVVDTVDPNRPLDNQNLKNTYGTDIQCVINHVLALPKNKTPGRILIFTDGDTGVPSRKSWKEFQTRKIHLYAGIIDIGWEDQLEPYATHTECLPELI